MAGKRGRRRLSGIGILVIAAAVLAVIVLLFAAGCRHFAGRGQRSALQDPESEMTESETGKEVQSISS